MKTSTVAWALTVIVVVLGLAWYVYANTSGGAYVLPNTVNVSGDMPADMTMPATTTPAAPNTTGSSTTVTSSTTLQVH